jgi:ADP-ribose pyrophosphatase YjhB (NUDIX family)
MKDNMENEEQKKEYFKPSVTSDVVCLKLTMVEQNADKFDASVCLIKRKNEPYKGRYALPGGFLEEGETISDCAVRELAEETGLKTIRLIPIGEFSEVKRDPRGQIVSFPFLSIFPSLSDKDFELKAGDDAKDAQWFKIKMADVTSKSQREKDEYYFDLILTNPKTNEVSVNTVRRVVGKHMIPMFETVKSGDMVAFDHLNIIATAMTKMPNLIMGKHNKQT